MGKLAPHVFAYVKKNCLEMWLWDKHKREQQKVAVHINKQL